MSKKKPTAQFKADSQVSRDANNVATVPDQMRAGYAARERRHHRVVGALAAAAVVAALGCGYGYGVYRFQNCFTPRTTVNGMDMSGKVQADVQAAIEEQAASYQDAVTVGEYQFTVTGDVIGYGRDAAGAAEAAWAQHNPYTWPLDLLVGKGIQVDEGVSYDENLLRTTVSHAASEYDSQHVQNGTVTLSYDSETHTYTASGQAEGTALNPDAVLAAMQEDIAALKTETNLDASQGMRPAQVEDTDIYRAGDIATRDIAANIDLNVNGETKTHINYEIVNWVWCDEEGNLVVDGDAINTWVKTMLGDALNTSDDTTNYDLDEDGAAEVITQRLQAGNTSPRELPMNATLRPEGESKQAYEAGASWDSSMGRYVDVDLSAQYARFYDADGSTLWESAIVSGNTSEDHATPQGTFYVNALMTDQELVGLDENGDGESDYTSYVNYWMPFVGNMVAFHDATWRTYFGDNIYQYDGSHGCINLPYKKAAELYNVLQVGDTVYVHD